jgi:hypothetical protein
MNEACGPLSPGTTPSNLMTFGQVLDRVYRLMRANLRPFLGIAAVPTGAVIVVSGLLDAALFLDEYQSCSGE